MRPYVLVAAGAAPRCVAQIRKCWRRLVSTKKGHPYILQLLPGECRAGGKVRAGSQVDVPPCAGRLLQDWHLEECAVAYIVFVRTLKDVHGQTKFCRLCQNCHFIFTSTNQHHAPVLGHCRGRNPCRVWQPGRRCIVRDRHALGCTRQRLQAHTE